MTTSTQCLTASGALLLALGGGCATVDPQPDYRRASAYVEQATGVTDILPEDAETIERHVAERLENGLTVAEAVEISLINNPEFQAAWMDVGMARADLVQAGLLSNPTLGLAIRLPSGGGLANVEGSIAQNIAEIWQIPARVEGAERDLNRAILELARRAAQLAAETKSAYHTAAGREQSYAIARENLDVAERLLETAIARREAGAGNELDVNLARSAALEARLMLRTARLDAAEAMRTLGRRLGLDEPADELVLNDEVPPPVALDLSLDPVIELAREHRLDFRAARENVAMASSRLQQERLGVLRTLELGVAFERGGRKEGVPKNTRPEEGEGPPEEVADLSVGPALGLEIPLFDQNQAQIARAEFAYQKAADLLIALQRAMIQDVGGAVDRTLTASELARLTGEEFLPLARENLALSEESYRAGKASVLAVLQAQRFLLDSRRREIVAQVDAANALVDLERVVGLPMDRIRSQVEETSDTTAETPDTENGGQL